MPGFCWCRLSINDPLLKSKATYHSLLTGSFKHAIMLLFGIVTHLSHIAAAAVCSTGSALPLLAMFSVQPTETILRDQPSVSLGKFQPVTVVLLHSAIPTESPQRDICPSSPQHICVEGCTVKHLSISTFVSQLLVFQGQSCLASIVLWIVQQLASLLVSKSQS